MPEYDRLQPPPVPQLRAGSIQRAPDLPQGMVRQNLVDVLQPPPQPCNGQWVFSKIPTQSIHATFQNFQGAGPEAQKHIGSVMEEAVGSDPSLLGTLKTVECTFLTSLGRSVATISDMLASWLVGGLADIERMQKRFLIDHAGDPQVLDADAICRPGAKRHA
jgi:hypothetical protein